MDCRDFCHRRNQQKSIYFVNFMKKPYMIFDYVHLRVLRLSITFKMWKFVQGKAPVTQTRQQHMRCMRACSLLR